MGKLAELLNQPEAKPVESKTIFDGEGNYTQTGVLDRQPQTPRDILEYFDHDPERFTLDGPTRVSHRELVDGRVVSTYSYKLLPLPVPVDIDDLAAKVKRAAKHALKPARGNSWFVYQAGDLQIGKRSRDGSTEEIVTGYLESVGRAVEEFARLDDDFGVSGVQISMPGDCVEGISSQGGRNAWLTEQTITEQTRILRRLMLATVEAFAPLTSKVYLDVVGGNHDEAQRQWNTYPGDNWATECAIAVDDALKMNPQAYGHVEVRVPNKWDGHMTVPVGNTSVTVVHGHQFGRAANGLKWWQEQAFNNHPPRGAHVLQNGHFHEVAVEQSGDRVRIQSPTFDMGSDWYREAHGCGNTRGALVYLLDSGRYSRLTLV